MLKKILLFIGFVLIIIPNFNNLYAETKFLIPLKKPTLSSQEFNKKISKNILKPLKKPIKSNKNVVEKKKLQKQLKKTNYHLKYRKRNQLWG